MTATTKLPSENAQNQTISIQAKTIFQARNLGHHKAPTGTYKAQTEVITQKAKLILDAIIRTKPTRTETKMLYDSVFRPATEYTLAQSHSYHQPIYPS